MAEPKDLVLSLWFPFSPKKDTPRNDTYLGGRGLQALFCAVAQVCMCMCMCRIATYTYTLLRVYENEDAQMAPPFQTVPSQIVRRFAHVRCRTCHMSSLIHHPCITYHYTCVWCHTLCMYTFVHIIYTWTIAERPLHNM